MDCARICVLSIHVFLSSWQWHVACPSIHRHLPHQWSWMRTILAQIHLPWSLHVMALVLGMRRDEIAVAFVDVCEDSERLHIVERLCVPADPAIATVRNASVECKRHRRTRRGKLTRTDERSTLDVR